MESFLRGVGRNLDRAVVRLGGDARVLAKDAQAVFTEVQEEAAELLRAVEKEMSRMAGNPSDVVETTATKHLSTMGLKDDIVLRGAYTKYLRGIAPSLRVDHIDRSVADGGDQLIVQIDVRGEHVVLTDEHRAQLVRLTVETLQRLGFHIVDANVGVRKIEPPLPVDPAPDA